MKPEPSNTRRYDRTTGRPDEQIASRRPVVQSASRRILGIDPGLATTGWGLIEKSPTRLQLLGYGAILTPAGQPLAERLRIIRRELQQLITAHAPEAMAIEELFFTKFAVSIAATAQARGVILLTAAELGVPAVEYNPRAVKIALTGFGSANKIQMQSMLQRHFGLKEIPRPDDAADAVAIALTHAQTRRELKVQTSRKSRAAFEAELAARAGVYGRRPGLRLAGATGRSS